MNFEINNKTRSKNLNEVNYMELYEFERLVDALDLSNSQQEEINAMLDQVKKEFKDESEKEQASQIPLFSVPAVIGSELWFTVRSKTINNSMLCITDQWYSIKLGRRGKVRINKHRWDDPKRQWYWMMF